MNTRPISIWRDSENPYRAIGIEPVLFGTPLTWRKMSRQDLSEFAKLMSKPPCFLGEILVKPDEEEHDFFNVPHFGFMARRKNLNRQAINEISMVNVWLSSALEIRTRQESEMEKVKIWVCNLLSQRYQSMFDPEIEPKKNPQQWENSKESMIDSYNFIEGQRIFSERKWLAENRKYL